MAMVTATENMVLKTPSPGLSKAIIRNAVLLSCLGMILLGGRQAHAMQWQYRPNMTMSEIFDDNLNLSQAAKVGGEVSEFAPGVIVSGYSPVDSFNLNYRLQGLYNAQNNDAVNVYHQLHMNSLFQPVANTFYVQTSSSIGQQNASNSLLAGDNIAGKNNRAQTETFTVTPYLTPHFGQYATGLIKEGFTGNYVQMPDNSAITSTIVNPISNSHTLLTQGGLTSGVYFKNFNWSLNYSSKEQHNDSGSLVRIENYAANTRYFVNRVFSVFTETGYENNGYLTNGAANRIKNGFYYTVGGKWQPSWWYSLQAGFGNNSQATLRFNPSENMTSHVTYYYKTVGLNLGSSWNAGVNYTTSMSKWVLSYGQETSTVQDLLANQDVFASNPLTGGGLTPGFNFSLPSLVNDVIISKTADINFTYRTGKSVISASVFNTRRNYQFSQEFDTLYGASANWQWQAIPRLTYHLRPFWQSTETTSRTSFNSQYYGVSTGLTRGIPINLGRPLVLNSSLELRHVEQSSSGSGASYIENRATANFFVQF